jgi:hypothetical protein
MQIMQIVYIEAMNACGLGNCLFQIAAAIHYCEKYNYTMQLITHHSNIYGTSNDFGKTKCAIIDGVYQTYDKTIFKNITYTNAPNGQVAIINNNYTDQVIVPGDFNLLIRGYCQNLNLYADYLHKMSSYLFLTDPDVIAYIHNKYGDVSNGICVGLRIGADFAHMKKLTTSSYYRALQTYQSMNILTDKIYVISDVAHAWRDKFNLQQVYPAIEVDENDIVQLYLGMMCSHYILSESTYHLWIAYLGASDGKNVICFNDSDITARKLDMDHWIHLDY